MLRFAEWTIATALFDMILYRQFLPFEHEVVAPFTSFSLLSDQIVQFIQNYHYGLSLKIFTLGKVEKQMTSINQLSPMKDWFRINRHFVLTLSETPIGL
jgi:hypothetical protein